MLIVLFLTAFPVHLFGFFQQPDARQAATAFEAEEYSAALKAFTGLLQQYPRDPMYHYYAGVCRVQLQQEPGKALENLQQAQSGGMFKSIPGDVLFYQGRAAQMTGDFRLAEKSFKAFRSQVRRKEYREYGADSFLEQVQNGVGALQPPGAEEAGGEPAGISRADSLKQQQQPSAREDTLSIAQAEPEKQEEKATLPEQVPETPAADTSLQKLEEAYETALHTALDWQFRADSVRRIADEKRRLLQTASEEQKNNLRQEILALEKLVFRYQRVADQKYSGVRKMELELYERQEQPVSPPREEEKKQQKPEEKPLPETEEPADTHRRQTDTARPPKMVLKKVPQTKEIPVYQMFEVNKPVGISGDRPVNAIPPLRKGLVYRIQVAVFRNPVPQGFFKGLAPVVTEKDPEKDLTWYYIGMFRTLESAQKALEAVHQKGFEDAFVVAYFNGNRQSFSRAEILEQEWAGKPLKTLKDTVWVEKEVPAAQATTDTAYRAEAEPVELTLSFRVKVKVSEEPLEEDELEEIKRLAVQKGWESYRTDKGKYAYVIGKFLTFENASEYADLLYRNGLRDAAVVAFLGTKEIPVELARKLTDQYNRP